MNVTSGPALVPQAFAPTYSATKAALHSYTLSLIFLLRGTAVQVVELAPPLVATDLTPGQRDDPRALTPNNRRESMALFARPAPARSWSPRRAPAPGDGPRRVRRGVRHRQRPSTPHLMR